MADYYEEFMVTLWEEGGKRFPVWCLSHAGHALLPSTAPRSSESLFTEDNSIITGHPAMLLQAKGL